MHRFPPLRLGSATLRIPLADDTAHLLAAVMIEPDESRCRQLDRQLAIDAALSLWALLCAEARFNAHPKTLAELASSVMESVRPVLAEALNEPGHFLELDEGRIRRAAVRSAAVAAFCHDDETALPEHLLVALLHNAREWFALSVEPAEQARADEAVDAWLAARHQELKHPAIERALIRYESIDATGPAPPIVAAISEAERLWHGDRRIDLPLGNLARLATDLHQQVEQQKLTALAELAAGAGHEMNNPLAVISGRAQLLLQAESDPDRRLDLATIHAQARRVHEMIAGLMQFAEPPPPELHPLDASAALAEIVDEFAESLLASSATIALHLDDDPIWILADKQQFKIALTALLENAVTASANDAAPITVSAQQQIAATGLAIRISVHNEGPAIPSDMRQHLFEPFFSGRSAGRGLGVGLSKCWRIVTGHGGTVTVESSASTGTTVSIVLPAIERA